MGDVRCGWCDKPLPDEAGPNRRYCGPAHRQAAWRARRRWEAAAQARHALVLADAELLSRARTMSQEAATQDPERMATATGHCAAAGGHSAAAAEILGLAEQLVRSAVLADRQGGADWARIGAGLGMSGAAARHRYGRMCARGQDGQRARGPSPPVGSTGSTDPEPLGALLLPAVRDTGASVSGIYLFPPGRPVLHLAVTTGGTTVALWERVDPAAEGPVAEAVREQRLVWVAGHAELAHRYPRAALTLPYPVAVAAAPVTTGATMWGALAFLWPGTHPRLLSSRERDAVTTACHRVGSFLRQAAADGRPVLPTERPHVPDPPRARTPGPAEALAAVDLVDRLPEGCLALDLDNRITFVDATARDLVGESIPGLLGRSLCEALPWLDEPVLQDHQRAAAISRRPAVFTALGPQGRWLDFELHPDVSGTTVRVTPADDAGPADHARRGGRDHALGPTRARVLYDLMHLAASLTEAVSVQDVVELAADQIMPTFDAQGFVLSVAEDGRLQIVGSRGYRDEVLRPFDGPPLTDRSAPTVYALTAGVPLFFGSPQDMERFHPDIPRLTGRAAWAFLPLVVSRRPVGCWVLSFDRPRPFGPDERAVLTSLAGLIAQALDRARLYDAKHQLAHDLQSGLLPTTLPAVPGLEVAARYLPAARGMDVGGDFYDLIRLDATTVAAAIGDVQGHNVHAAALMGQIRTAVHVTAGASPDEVLARANRLLTDFDPGLFASCLYAHLDLARHRARLATAGHPPPLLRDAGGRTEVLDLPPGLLLGIDPAAEYRTTEIPLPPDSLLALYTDGLIETPGGDIGEAAADLADHLARTADQPIGTLADALVRHTPHTDPRSDDVALLLLRATDAA
ncbi:SpoIIE family protein phosphatase [Streptomyces sp. NBC_01176]|uniref:SpoIIE family protein phosphatase n=1 Tax=Streptomyces sp. NBC_01176 TaxID=2903760 RepID=UPI00386F459E|nr:SpoIIE family protein phosphatase [Streptomyces sp. NBC_01176]